MKLLLLLAIACPIVFPLCAAGATIGLYSTPDCTSCNLTVPEGGTRTLYINVATFGMPTELVRLTGAEFRVTGLPSGWTAAAIPNPAASEVRGNPFGGHTVPLGAWIGFSEPLPLAGCTNLYTVRVTATTYEADVRLRAARALNATVADCMYITVDCHGECDNLNVRCVDAGEMLINSDLDCTVAVQADTWSRIKRLYRE